MSPLICVEFLFPSHMANKIIMSHICKTGSVVAIHGLHGDSKNTWTELDEETEVWMQHAFKGISDKGVRVITFGYDPADDERSCYTLHGIYEMAEELLSRLLELRMGIDEVSLGSNLAWSALS